MKNKSGSYDESEKMITPNKFSAGEIVYERIYPSKKMVITGYSNGIYYCNVVEDQTRKPLVYMERDLMADSNKEQ